MCCNFNVKYPRFFHCISAHCFYTSITQLFIHLRNHFSKFPSIYIFFKKALSSTCNQFWNCAFFKPKKRAPAAIASKKKVHTNPSGRPPWMDKYICCIQIISYSITFFLQMRFCLGLLTQRPFFCILAYQFLHPRKTL